MKRKYRILAIEEEDYKEITKRLLDIYDVDQFEYTPEQLAAFDKFWDAVEAEAKDPRHTDAVLFDYQRLMLTHDVAGELPRNSEEMDVVIGINSFMDAISDAFWPHITNDLTDRETPFTEQLKKLIDND